MIRDVKIVIFLRSEEHTSELQSRGLNSYAVFCLKKKKNNNKKKKKKKRKDRQLKRRIIEESGTINNGLLTSRTEGDSGDAKVK